MSNQQRVTLWLPPAVGHRPLPIQPTMREPHRGWETHAVPRLTVDEPAVHCPEGIGIRDRAGISRGTEPGALRGHAHPGSRGSRCLDHGALPRAARPADMQLAAAPRRPGCRPWSSHRAPRHGRPDVIKAQCPGRQVVWHDVTPPPIRRDHPRPVPDFRHILAVLANVPTGMAARNLLLAAEWPMRRSPEMVK